MDSYDPFILVLSGQSDLRRVMEFAVMEPFNQRALILTRKCNVMSLQIFHQIRIFYPDRLENPGLPLCYRLFLIGTHDDFVTDDHFYYLIRLH